MLSPTAVEALPADVRKKFAGRDDVVLLTVNADEEEALAAPFLQAQKVEGTLVLADGLGNNFRIESIPTIIVLDRTGGNAYRAQGVAPDRFVDIVSGATTKASSGPAR